MEFSQFLAGELSLLLHLHFIGTFLQSAPVSSLNSAPGAPASLPVSSLLVTDIPVSHQPVDSGPFASRSQAVFISESFATCQSQSSAKAHRQSLANICRIESNLLHNIYLNGERER